MRSTLLILALLAISLRAAILQLERWPILEGMAKNDLQNMLQALQEAAFPSYTYQMNENLIPSYLQVFNFRVSAVEPRIMFLKPTFYPKPDQDTYSINVPLGYHMTAEFEWVYNLFAFPMSGHAVFDTDVHSLVYNITLNLTSPDNIVVSTHINYTMVPVKGVTIHSILSPPSISDTLVTVMKSYLPLMKNATEEAFTTALSARYNNLFAKSYQITLHYSTFQYSFAKTEAISAVTTRGALLLAYGPSTTIPDEISVSDTVRRQYCVDQGLINAVVEEVWPKMKAEFKSGSLPPDSPFPLTVSGLAMFIPDVANDISRNAATTLSIESVEGKADVRLEKINETHALARGFKTRLRFQVDKKPVLTVTLAFDMIVVPYAVKLGDSFTFNVRARTAVIHEDSLAVDTKYRTVITSNLQEACGNYVNGLLLPFMGFALFGDGLVIKDDVTPYAHAENSVASSAICLNLAYDS